jgi:hypothetical protein
MKTEKNPFGAGRKKKFTVPTKKMIVPIVLEGAVNELSKPYLTKKL